ncbi:FliM/FliN family flagellar motor switch protein [Desulfothermus sp.]
MIRPLLIDSISSLARDIYNLVYSKKFRTDISLLEEKVVVHFNYKASLKPPYWFLSSKTKFGEIFIVIDGNILSIINQYYGIDISVLDTEIKLGLFKALWEELKKNIQLDFLVELYTIEFMEDISDLLKKCHINFVLEFLSGLNVCGVIGGSEIVISQLLSELTSKMKVEREDILLTYPCYMIVLVGKTNINIGDLASLEQDDIVLLEKFYPRDNKVFIKTGPFLFECELDNQKIIVSDIVKEVQMSDDAVENKKIDINEIPITLTFSVGKIEISFGELKNIQPGYVFNLDKSMGSYIEILANGKMLGTGELVEIDGRVGVRLKEFNSTSFLNESKENSKD